MDTEIRFFALNSTKEKVLDRVQQQPLIPPKVLTFSPIDWEMLRRSRRVLIFL